jgi:hypothetical protein
MAPACIASVTNYSSLAAGPGTTGLGYIQWDGASTVPTSTAWWARVGLALLAAKVASVVTGAALAVGITAAVVLFGLHLLYQQQRAAFLVLRPPAQASSA